MAKKNSGLRFNKGGSKSRKLKKPETKSRPQKSTRPRMRREENRPNQQDEDFNFEEFIVVGKNPVIEALRSDLQIERLLILKDNKDHVLNDISDKAKDKNLVVQSVERQKLEQLAGDRPHQGVAALMAPFPYTDLDQVIEQNKDEENAVLVILDHITDPHNFGAIIRSAEVLGAKGVIFPQRRSAGLSPAAVKASSGAAAYIPLAKVNNLSQTVDKLKENGYWVAGTDMDGEVYYKSNLKGKIALIMGSEGSGLSPKLEKQCDFMLSIPEYGKVDSLNVSAAAAIILAEAARQQHS